MWIYTSMVLSELESDDDPIANLTEKIQFQFRQGIPVTSTSTSDCYRHGKYSLRLYSLK
jgi:hypothetical protein